MGDGVPLVIVIIIINLSCTNIFNNMMMCSSTKDYDVGQSRVRAIHLTGMIRDAYIRFQAHSVVIMAHDLHDDRVV